MERVRKKATLDDVALLIKMLQKEWGCSKEAVWRVEVPPCILETCKKEIEGMSRYLQDLSENGGENEELPLFRRVYATKDAYVLIRVAKKLLTASKEAEGRKKLVISLDEEEYRLVVTRFLEYL